MAERVKLAGIEAHIGPVVFGMFLVLGVLAVVGVGVLLATGEVHATAGELATYAGGVVVVGLWARWTVRDLRNVRLVVVDDGGAWRLRGPLGIPRGEIAAGTPRVVTHRTRAAGSTFGVIRFYEATWAEIEAGGRRWVTCRGIPSSNDRAIARLQQLARG